MSEKTLKGCWLVDEKNGIATDGKRYWCAMKDWKCAKGMIEVSELKDYLLETKSEIERKLEDTGYEVSEDVLEFCDILLERFCGGPHD